MKRLAISCALLFFAADAWAQSAAHFEPDYVGIIVAVDAATNNVIQLPRETPAVRTRVRGLGFGGGESIMEFPGPTCAMRFPSSQTLEFIARASSQQTDPQTIIQFFHVTTAGAIRRMQLANVGAMGMSARSTVGDAAVPFNASRHGQSSFRFSPRQPLPPGEYVVSLSEARDGFCFAVDP